MMKKVKPHVAAFIIQCNFAGFYLLSKASLSSGIIASSVFVAYRQAFATLALAPFAFFAFFASNKESPSPPLTCCALGKIFIVSAYGLALSFNLSMAGVKYTSATFSSAILSISPATVFIIAICLRIESLAITKWHGIAKVGGSIIGLAGAMAFTFYKGPALFPAPSAAISSIAKSYTRGEWIKGAFLLVASQFIWSHWLVLQGPLQKQYPEMLRLTTLQCGFSFIASTIYAAAVERDVAAWKLGWNIGLLSISYCGVVVTGVTYCLQAWVIQKRGPVFIAIYCPLSLALSAILSAIFLKETLYTGSILGAALIVGGLYCFLWGQNQEPQAQVNLGPTMDEESRLECITHAASNGGGRADE